MDGEGLIGIWDTYDGSSIIQLLGTNVVVLRQRLDSGGTEPTAVTRKAGTNGEDFREGGSGYANGGEILCGGGASGASVWVKDVGNEPLVGEGP